MKQKNYIVKNYPGSQKRVRSFNLVFFFLTVLATLFFFLTVYEVLRQNYPENYSLFGFRWISILKADTACSIFASMISLILIRHHFVLGFKPRIIYECAKTKDITHPELDSNSESLFWQVKIKNVGLGSAVIKSFKLRIGIESINESNFELDVRECNKLLAENEIHCEHDYYISNITNGYALQAKDEKVIFEINLQKGQKIKQIDVRLIFEGYLGGKYEKDVYLIPRAGIPVKSAT